MDTNRLKRVFVIVSFGFVAFGILNASIGPLLEELAANNGVSLSSIGSIYSALFFGGFVAQVALGPFTDHWGHQRVLALSFILLSVLLAVMTFSHWLPLTLALIFIAGMGYGMAVLSGNVLVGQLFPEKSVATLNWVNMFFGVGDIIGPLLVSLSLSVLARGIPALWFGGVAMFLVAVFLLLFPTNAQNHSDSKEAGAQKPFRVSPFLLTLSGMILVYVGTEASMGGWTTSYIQSTAFLTTEKAALVTSGFWLALTVGRLIGALLGGRILPQNLLKLSMGLMLAGGIVFIAGYGNLFWSVAAVMIIGVGCGPTFPTIIAIMTTTYKGDSGKAGTLLTATGSISGTLIPWLQGIMLGVYGMRSVAIFITALSILLIIVFLFNQSVRKKMAA